MISRIVITIALTLSLSSYTIAQEVVEDSSTFIIIEEPHQFPGGIKSFYKYINKNLKYPKKAQRKKIEGKVFVKFFVTPSGSVQNIEVIRGIGYGCDEEAVRLMQNCPKWNPLRSRGKAKNVAYVLPIYFRLKK